MPNPRIHDIDDAISSGLSFLRDKQEEDGSFVSYSSPAQHPFRETREWHTVFVPALILNSISGLDRPRAKQVRSGLANFLLKEKSNTWSFNYWAKAASEHTSQPYPDDLDDTFCALIALYRHDPSLVGSGAMAKIVHLLMATEVKVGGPYRTWLVPKGSEPVWLDVDLAVNSNVAYFLALAGSELPSLQEYMGKGIARNEMTSPYYPNERAMLYYLARSYSGDQKAGLLKRVRQMEKSAKTDLDRALCICARLNLGDDEGVYQAIEEILSRQESDGSWPAASFYADPVIKGNLYYNGGAALTTAFVLEALDMYVAHKMESTPSQRTDVEFEKFKQTVLRLGSGQYKDVGIELRDPTLDMLRKIAEGSNGEEIIRLGYNFDKSLKISPAKPKNFMAKLGLANLCGWLAYTIYDDFLDGEGRPELLSVANLSMRRSMDNFFAALPEDDVFEAFVRATFDEIDGSNAWELSNCRFAVESGKINILKLPDYSDMEKIAERSVGHILPVMGVLKACGYVPESKPAIKIRQAFRHYLVARQLNDDAHDWEDDLRRGQITPVVEMIIKGLKIKPGKQDISNLIPKARNYFWKEALAEVCDIIHDHVRSSRKALKNSGLVADDSTVGLEPLLLRVEASVDEALAQQRQAKDFLKHYKTKTG